MSMNRYLETFQVKEIREYCQNRCIKIVNEHLENKAHLAYFRGKYKTYLYMIKVCNTLLKKNIQLKRYELYNHLKTQQYKVKYDCTIPNGFGKGMIDSFYDLLNFISDINYNFN